jgi:threonyl-tRNA synthetase
MADAVSLVFPDGSQKHFDAGTTGRDVAESISKSLAKKAVAIALDGELRDLTDPVVPGAIEIVTRDDPRALELIRHDAAHVMAEAVQALWPGTQVTIGPVIENGFYYDFKRVHPDTREDWPFTPDDLPVIEKKMREIIQRNAPFTKEVWSRDKARDVFADMGEAYKVELVDAIPDGQDLKIYKQGDWFDLCRGPHMDATGRIGGAFKLMKVAGAYWRGDATKPMLTRIYGTAWANQQDLDAYLHMLEEAEKRDHRRLGREMDLFHFQEEGPGVVFWHAKGWRMFQSLLSYMRRRIEDDYDEVNAPQVLDNALWQTSGHWGWYRENMFAVTCADEEAEDTRVFALKPMNCPGHVQIFKHGLKSYRELPIRLAEFGAVHRYEPSGALHGLMRVRGFTQDDAHVFCTEDQLEAEIMKINDLMMSVYQDFGFDEVVVKLATRPEKRVGSDESWDHAEDILKRSLEKMAREDSRIKTGINEGEGTFYGPKFEYTLKDAIGREWQCGTTQVDFNLPERFGAFYIDRDSEKKQPVMIHRAIVGSLERFLGILIESHAGHFPLWFAPLQVVVATITQDADDYAVEVARKLKDAGLQVQTDLRNEKINYKIREHSVAKVPVILVCGRREAEEGTVNVRRLGSRDQESKTVDELIGALRDEATPPDLVRKAGRK